jgi:hypothetical protein
VRGGEAKAQACGQRQYAEGRCQSDPADNKVRDRSISRRAEVGKQSDDLAMLHFGKAARNRREFLQYCRWLRSSYLRGG